jgi:hypothetical protein
MLAEPSPTSFIEGNWRPAQGVPFKLESQKSIQQAPCLGWLL